MGFSFIVKQPPQYLFNDEFETYDTATWITEINLDNIGVDSGWLNFDASINYGELYTKDLGLTEISGTNFQLTSRLKQIGLTTTGSSNFGFTFDGVGFWWYGNGPFDRYRRPANSFWNGVDRGILATTEPLLMTVTQKNNLFTVKVEYEELAYQIYDWEDSIANSVAADGSGQLMIGPAWSGSHWKIDYVRLDTPV